LQYFKEYLKLFAVFRYFYLFVPRFSWNLRRRFAEFWVGNTGWLCDMEIPWRRRQHVPMKPCHTSVQLHYVITHRTTVFTGSTART